MAARYLAFAARVKPSTKPSGRPLDSDKTFMLHRLRLTAPDYPRRVALPIASFIISERQLFLRFFAHRRSSNQVD